MKTRDKSKGRPSTPGPTRPGNNMKKNRLFNAVFISVAFFLTCGFIAFGAYFQAEERLHGIAVGYPSPVNVLAPRVVENTIATDINRQAAEANAATVPPVMAFDPEVWPTVEFRLNFLADELEAVREYHALEVEAFERAEEYAALDFQRAITQFNEAMGEWTSLRDTILAADGEYDEIPAQPVEPVPPEPLEPDFQVWARFDDLPVTFNEAQQALILSYEAYAYDEIWDIIMYVAYAVQATDIYNPDSYTTLEVMRGYLGPWVLDQDTRNLIESIVVRHLTSNRIVNIEATQTLRDAAASSYQREMVQSGETVVRIGDIVTEEIYAILGQLGLLEDTTLGNMVIPIVAAFFIVILLFLACIMYLHFYRPTVAAIKREAFLLFSLYTLTLTAVWALRNFDYPFLPVLIFPMLVSVLIERRSAIVLSFAMTLISYFIVIGSWDFLMFFLISGLVVAMLSRFTTERNKIFLVGAAVSVIQFALSVSIAVIMDFTQAVYSITGMLTTAGFAAFNGLLTVIISTGSLPIWESFFGVVTPVKLLDLTNPTNLLLRRLTIEAPGTYHHSLIVANLAETAAYDIGANAHAARVGGYYHDIGKLKYPHYFAENLDGDNPHDHLDAIDSARLIISHVSYGLTLATEHRLPQFVRDIIQEHHGNSLVKFFYHKATKTGEEVDEADYRYPFNIPQTKESACVRLADAVEAAMRAMMPKLKSPEEVESTIRGLVYSAFNDGQLTDSQLSIKDLEVIVQSFVRVLKGMYHERITYPKLVPVGDAESVISASSRD